MRNPLKTVVRLRRRRPGWRLRMAGDAARDRRDWPAADAAYANYLTLAQEDWAIWVQRGHAQKEMGDLAGAERCYRRAVDINPPMSDPFFQLAELLRHTGHRSAAIDHYRRAAELGEQRAIEMLAMLGINTSSLSGDDTGSLRWIANKALVRTLLDAQAARDLRQWDKAESLYLAYLRGRPDSPQAMAELKLVRQYLQS